MHESVMAWTRQTVDRLGTADWNTLEVGSYDVNGSVRGLFTGPYLGVDRYDGPGVDQVCDGEALPFGPAEFDQIVSTEALEHALRPWLVVYEMGRVCASGGWLILTCRGFDADGSFPFHNPPDEWRCSAAALAAMVADAGFDSGVVERDPQVPGWFVTARKT